MSARAKELWAEMIRAIIPGTSQASSEKIISTTTGILWQTCIFGSIYLSISRKWPIYWIVMPAFLLITTTRRGKQNEVAAVNQQEIAEEENNLPTWGVLRVHVIEAKNLMHFDDSSFRDDQSQPFAVLLLGEEKFETQLVTNMGTHPKWDSWCEFIVFPELAFELRCEVWLIDELLGSTSIDIRDIAKRGSLEKWFELQDVENGSLSLYLQWYELTNDPNNLDVALQEVQDLHITTLSSSVLSVFIESAKNLKPFDETDALPDPYVICSVNDQCEKSNIIMRTDAPVWEQGLSLLVQDPNFDVLKIEIYDNKTDMKIGEYEFDISMLLEMKNLEMGLHYYILDNAASESEITMALSLAILKKKDVSNDDEVSGEEPRRQPPIWLNELSLKHYNVDEMTNQTITFVEPTITHKFYPREPKIFNTNEISAAMKTVFSNLCYIPTCMTTAFVAHTSNYDHDKFSASDNFCNKFPAVMKFPIPNKMLLDSETPKMIQCLSEENSPAIEQSLEC